MCYERKISCKVGDTLKAIVTPEDATGVTYQWYADDAKIAGETTATYLVKPTDVSKRFSVEATVDGETVMSEKTTAVGVEASINEVKLSNTAPKVGDEIIAYAYDENGNDISDQVTWQWYRTTLASGQQNPISNATKKAYTITSMDSAGTVYVWATDANGTKIKSSEAEIVKQSDITEIEIEGMTGKKIYSKVNDVAAVGDNLSVKIGSALSDLEFQWYRGGAAINGATAPLYTVVEDDLESDLCVKIKIPGTQSYYFDKDCTTNADGIYADVTGIDEIAENEKEVYVNINTKVLDRGPIAQDISDIKMTFSSTEPVIGKKITASVAVDKNGDGDTDDANDRLTAYKNGRGDAYFAWYRGEVKPENQIWGAIDTSYTLTNDDLGKEITCVATAVDEKNYTLSTQATLPAAYIEITKAEIISTTDGYISSAVARTGADLVGTELVAKAIDAYDKDRSDKVSYQWYRNGEAIVGATNKVYTISDEDLTDEFLGETDNAGTDAVQYTVAVEANADNCIGDAVSAATAINGNDSNDGADKGTITRVGLFKGEPEFGTTAAAKTKLAANATVHVGDTLVTVI